MGKAALVTGASGSLGKRNWDLLCIDSGPRNALDSHV